MIRDCASSQATTKTLKESVILNCSMQFCFGINWPPIEATTKKRGEEKFNLKYQCHPYELFVNTAEEHPFHSGDMAGEGRLRYVRLQKEILQIKKFKKESLRSNTGIANNLKAKKQALMSLSPSHTHTHTHTLVLLQCPIHHRRVARPMLLYTG